ncbi:MAG: AtpZ/AtpI family protein [Planctomycetota bacterium]|nr:MAG: AtpZ/AtpI family protein [Planctomycetota bacterium]
MAQKPRFPDGPHRLAVAMQWVSVITTIGMEMALPAVVGAWLDRRWNTSPWCVAVGAAIGFAVGITHLLQVVSGQHRASPPASPRTPSSGDRARTAGDREEAALDTPDETPDGGGPP